MGMTDRYLANDLAGFASGLLSAAGMSAQKARLTAEMLLEGDLLGHTTHGLGLLTQNIDELEAGRMLGDGEPEVTARAAATQTWNGRRLPGPWLTVRAIDWARRTAMRTGVAAVAIHHSCHIGCLAAYVRVPAEQGLMVIVTCSDPSTSSVAPFGGTRRIITPNPLAAGWPTPGGPVMIDISMSNTTNGMTARLRSEGRSFDHPWLMDGEGNPTRDPNAFFADPPGSLLPLGGIEAGHKGFALGLLIEALTSALAGSGRADGETRWGAAVTVMVIDPAKFGGSDAFVRETGWIADAVHKNPPRAGGERPRLPGERALALRRQQLEQGVALHSAVVQGLSTLAKRYRTDMPTKVGEA
jgi:L-lactate dehydrogenase